MYLFMSLDITFILYSSLFIYAGYVGFLNGKQHIKDTRNGLVPGYESKDNNNYFFLIDYD